MNTIIHFLLQDPNNDNGYIYPQDLDRPDYQGNGLFFITGQSDHKMEKEYTFPAVLEDRIVSSVAQRRSETSTYFNVNVPDISNFNFVAARVWGKAVYTGHDEMLRGAIITHQLKPTNPTLLDLVVRRFGFYFVGYSPRLR